MILIITHKTDYTADYVVSKLNRKGIEYKRFNCEDLLLSQFDVRLMEDFQISLLNEKKYHSVWFRRTKLPIIEGLPHEEKTYILGEIESFLSNIFSTLEAKWLSFPSSVYKAENKLLQLKTAKQIGFRIPPTLITNSKSELKDFYHENEQNIIVKPLSQTRISYRDSAAFIFTNSIPQSTINELDQIDLVPCIFQKNIAKDYEIRVTIVGDKVFAASVDSQSDDETKIDWRKKKLQFSKVELPINIKNLCIQLIKELNLSFGAIDLIKSPDGSFYFLEINPNGQWVWIENQTGQKISDAVIEYLTND